MLKEAESGRSCEWVMSPSSVAFYVHFVVRSESVSHHTFESTLLSKFPQIFLTISSHLSRKHPTHDLDLTHSLAKTDSEYIGVQDMSTL